MEFKDYQKYKWFVTSEGNLVIGGKSAEQNEKLLRLLKSQKKERVIMHTSAPGSPFSVILADVKSISESEIKECAIFTGCFSRAWKDNKKKVLIDIFKLSQLHKSSIMKEGTWGVKGEIRRMPVTLSLVLTRQKDKLRAVPKETIKSKKDIIISLLPGKVDKSLILPKIQIEIDESLNQEELLNALPTGGFRIEK